MVTATVGGGASPDEVTFEALFTASTVGSESPLETVPAGEWWAISVVAETPETDLDIRIGTGTKPETIFSIPGASWNDYTQTREFVYIGPGYHIAAYKNASTGGGGVCRYVKLKYTF